MVRDHNTGRRHLFFAGMAFTGCFFGEKKTLQLIQIALLQGNHNSWAGKAKLKFSYQNGYAGRFKSTHYELTCHASDRLQLRTDSGGGTNKRL